MKLSHYQEFAAHQVRRHGPQTAAGINAAFKNVGNDIPDDADAQLAAHEDLAQDQETGAITLKQPDAPSEG